MCMLKAVQARRSCTAHRCRAAHWRTAAVPLHRNRELVALPFFIYALVDEDIVVARGRSGGVALWGRADPQWAAGAGVLQVYK